MYANSNTFRIVRACILNSRHSFSTSYCKFRKLVLGIESSCDDTGAAVVDDNGKILGESLNSQMLIHLENGGIMPPLARDLHRDNIATVVDVARQRSGVSYEELDAVAVTNRPGLAACLKVGTEFAKDLVKRINKPLIPIHHMEAHALTIRMVEKKVEFPFLVLLISGGHSNLAIAVNVDKFLLLGKCLDDAPGEAFDKTARRLKLRNIPECSSMNGGQAIEYLARQGNPLAFEYPSPLGKFRNCHFSFCGLKAAALKKILLIEAENDIKGDQVIPNISDFCASFQYGVTHHMIKRTQRAMEYCDRESSLPFKMNRIFVISGGVACNKFVQNSLRQLSEHMGFEFYCPPPQLCTDNGIMIAWNGMERLKAGIGIVEDVDAVEVFGRCPMGIDKTEEITSVHIKLSRFKLDLSTNKKVLKTVEQDLK